MIPLEEAYEKILSHFEVLEPEERPLLECLGRVLAEEVYATFDIPPLPNSAMDGYAVQAQSVKGATASSPRVLQVIGEVAAGYVPTQRVTPGTALRIMTGAPVPEGADTVVPFEDTDEVERLGRLEGKATLTEIAVLKEKPIGQNVRPAGEDVRRGEQVLERGRVLRPAELGVLASLGWSRVRVIRAPVVSLLATGDELVEPGEPLPPGKIYNSNAYTMASQVLQYGGIPKVLGIARDTYEDLATKIREGTQADFLITSAGVSLGDYDIVKRVLADHGEITLWSVRIRPGKPLAFGLFPGRAPDGSPKRVPHLGLPGNPVSSMVAFELFARPAILKMMGKTTLAKPTIDVVLEENVPNRGGRRFFACAVVRRRNGEYIARLSGPQGSNILTSMAAANALVIIPEEVELAPRGSVVKAQMLDWPEGMELG